VDDVNMMGHFIVMWKVVSGFPAPLLGSGGFRWRASEHAGSATRGGGTAENRRATMT